MYRSGVLQIDQLEDQVQGRDKISDAPSDKPRPMCGFQLEFVSISHVVNQMTYYNSSALIGWNDSIQTGEQIL